jgi:hypothetical protein
MVTPSSPAFTILGIEPTSVDRPGTPTDLKVSLRNATDNWSTLPRDYALEFYPTWLFFGKNITYKDYLRKFAPLQSLSISVGSSLRSFAVGDSFTQSLGIGAHSSILRGKIDSTFQDYAARLNTVYANMAVLNDAVAKEVMNRAQEDELRNLLESQLSSADPATRAALDLAIAARRAQIHQEVEQKIRGEYQEQLEQIKKTVSEMQVRRVGLKWDAAGALALDFPQGDIGDVSLTKYGIWTTLGYEGQDEIITGLDLNGSFLLLARYLGDLNDQDQSNIDLGGRGILTKTKQGISVSVEGVGRLPPSFDFDDFDWRLAGIVELGFFRNTAVSFTFGRDFDNDLLSAINFSWGLGSVRPVR